MFAFASAAHADIFQWEYINPADPSQGKRQSTTPAPDGVGVDAAPGANLSFFWVRRNLTMAYLDGADLNHATLRGTILQNASLRGANLQEADLSTWRSPFCDLFGSCLYYSADLTAADLSQADLTSANLYQANLDGAKLLGTKLINANLNTVTLTDADFTGAHIRGANVAIGGLYGCCVSAGGVTLEQLYSTASYHSGDLSGINFSGNSFIVGNFAGRNLARVNFAGAQLTGADFSSAEIRGASFATAYYIGVGTIKGTGITLDQLYSTASYQAHELSGIGLVGNNLASGNFVSQNHTNATFDSATLTDADLHEANLTNASFYFAALTGADLREANLANAFFGNTTLTGADLTATDARGASLYPEYAGAITTNLIWPDGHLRGLDLDAGELLLVRDYDGGSRYVAAGQPIPITVDQHLTMGPGGALRMVSRRMPGIRPSPSRPASRSRSAARWNSPSPTT
jgi:uncharacterized protein YjbI with pentapeptide repeats